MKLTLRMFLCILIGMTSLVATSQPTQIGGVLDYENPQEYLVAGITVTGVQYTDINTIKLFAGIKEGDRITVPGDKITTAIKNLWRQQLFADVAVYAAEIRGSDIYLVIDLKEMPRMSQYRIAGVKKSEKENIREATDLFRGRIVNENLITTTRNQIIDYYIDKGFYNAEVEIKAEVDETIDNSVKLLIDIRRNERVKISSINIYGADKLDETKILRSMRETKEQRWWRIFKSSKYIQENFEDDQKNILASYNAKGFRNARITADSVYLISSDRVAIDLTVEEGNKFYFRDITFSGNTK